MSAVWICRYLPIFADVGLSVDKQLSLTNQHSENTGTLNTHHLWQAFKVLRHASNARFAAQVPRRQNRMQCLPATLRQHSPGLTLAQRLHRLRSAAAARIYRSVIAFLSLNGRPKYPPKSVSIADNFSNPLRCHQHTQSDTWMSVQFAILERHQPSSRKVAAIGWHQR